jgi:hypothetical protein
MTDAELAEYLHLTPAEAGLIIPRLPLEIARGAYRRTKQQASARSEKLQLQKNVSSRLSKFCCAGRSRSKSLD